MQQRTSTLGDLVTRSGEDPLVGAWDHPLEIPNLEDAHVPHALSRLARRPGLGVAERTYRTQLRLKTWQYMTVVSDDLFLAFVVASAGFASNGFVYGVELGPGARGTVHQRFAITPLRVGVRMSPTSTSGRHSFASRALSVEIDNLDGGRRFAARIRGTLDNGKPIDAELAFTSSSRDEHLSLCVPLADGRWNYTHKLNSFGVSGRVAIGDKVRDLAPDRVFGTLDFTKMYALRHAVWRWIAVCGRTKHGKVIAFNFVDPTPVAPVTENAVWIDGTREPLDRIRIDVRDDSGDAVWRVRTDTLELEGRPIAEVEQRLDVPLVRHRLRHLVTSFSGRIRTANGHVHDFEDLVGIAEDNDTWW